MATTPNFLWLEAILRHARDFLAARPDSPHTEHYRESVDAALEVFISTRKNTDRTYLTWREAYHEVIRRHKIVRQVYDAARKECIEWGLDDFPDHFVSYLDEEPTQSAAEDMHAFLSEVEMDTDWIEGTLPRLRQAIDDARQKIVEQEELLRTYRHRVRERKLGYDRAYALSKELFAALRPDLERDSEDYRRLSPYPIT